MNKDTIRWFRWLTAGWPPDTCLELRILSRRGAPLTGFFTPDDVGLAAAARAAEHWGGGLGQVYAGLNPRRAELLHAAPNRMAVTGRAGREADVAAVTALLVDIDPHRPKGTASTKTELAAARDVARAIDRWWREQGWYPPLVTMSGNGYHLWARVPPQDPGVFPGHLRAFLQDIARRFGNGAVDVDLSVADAPRIAKVPGTVSVKGENTVDRPWRRAAIAAWSDPKPNDHVAAHIRALEPLRHISRGTERAAHPPAGQLKPCTMLDRVLNRCRFVRWARDNPAAVREPAWHALATNLAVFEGGLEAFHALSRGYPGYDPRETEKKFHHARKAPGPATCQYIANLGEYGYRCPLIGTCPARAPAALAHVDDGTWAAVTGAVAPDVASALQFLELDADQGFQVLAPWQVAALTDPETPVDPPTAHKRRLGALINLIRSGVPDRIVLGAAALGVGRDMRRALHDYTVARRIATRDEDTASEGVPHYGDTA